MSFVKRYCRHRRISSSAASPRWNNLPPDLLVTITDHLDITSFIRLSAVCTSWASTIRPRCPSFPFFSLDRPVPWLLLSAHQNFETDPHRNRTVLTFYDLNTSISYSIPVIMPLLSNHRWLGSYNGWLITLDPQLQLHIIRPLTGADVLLPSIDSMGYEQPKKVILCHTSENTNDLPVAFCLSEQGSLWIAKYGDERWTSITYNTSYQDIILYQGNVYAVSTFAFWCYSPRSSYTEREMVVNIKVWWEWKKYVVECEGQLYMLLIDMNLGLEIPMLNVLQLYKVNLKDIARPLIQVTSLGHNALFLGANCSYTHSVSASGCYDIRENCIYFTDHVSSCPCHDGEEFHPDHNFGVFNLGDRKFTPCCPYSSSWHLPVPIWFWPR